MTEPQELQKAITHLIPRLGKKYDGGVYRKSAGFSLPEPAHDNEPRVA